MILGISFRAEKGATAVYSDADFSNCLETRRSYTGYILKVGSAVVSWRLTKQSTVSSSTTEAEYKALYEAIQEATWFSILLQSLHRPPLSPISVYSDNQAAIGLAKNPMYQRRSKHFRHYLPLGAREDC